MRPRASCQAPGTGYPPSTSHRRWQSSSPGGKPPQPAAVPARCVLRRPAATPAARYPAARPVSPPSEDHTGVHDRTNSHRATSKKGPLLMILIELIFDAPPEAHDNVAELARRTTAATHRENGCILYRFTTDLDHPS